MASFSIIRGVSKTINVALADQLGTAIDLTGYSTVKLIAAPDFNEPSVDLMLNKSLTVDDAANGLCSYDFVPADTAGSVAGLYRAEVKVTYNDGKVYVTEQPFLLTMTDPVEAP